MAKGSFVCNASIVGLWLGTEGGMWLEVHLFVIEDNEPTCLMIGNDHRCMLTHLMCMFQH